MKSKPTWFTYGKMANYYSLRGSMGNDIQQAMQNRTHPVVDDIAGDSNVTNSTGQSTDETSNVNDIPLHIQLHVAFILLLVVLYVI